MSSKQNVEKEEQKSLFRNLLALGINPQAVEHKYRCQLDENTFNKPNKKAFEIVAHFLFHKLNSKQAAELFRSCFPCTDKKTTQEFRKVCYNWLKRIVEENRGFGFPRVNASIFMSPGEKDFVYLMLMFSTFVLYKLTTAMQPGGVLRPVTLAPKQLRLAQAQMNTLAAMTVQDFKEAQIQMKLIKKTDEELRNFADAQLDIYHALQKKKQFLLQKKRAMLGDSAKVSRTRLAEIQQTQKENLESKIQHVRAMWKLISDTAEEGASRREIMESVIGRNQKTHVIDGNQLQLNVPAKLVDQCQEEIYRIVGTSLYKGGKMNLTSLVSLGNLSLSLVSDCLHEDGLPNFEKQDLWLKTQVKIHEGQLSKLNYLSEKIEEESRNKEQTISGLKQELDAMYEASALHNQEETSSPFGLDLPDSSVSDSIPYGNSMNTTEQLSTETTMPAEQMQGGLLRKALYPSGEDLEPFLERIVCPSEATRTPDTSSSSTSTGSQVDFPYQAWVIDTRPDTPKTSRQKASPKQDRKVEKPAPSARGGLAQGKQRHVAFDDRISSGLRKHLSASLTPDGKRATTLHSNTPQAPRSKGRKSMSLPSSPMVGVWGDDVTIERIASRTPEADQKLIEQIVDSTLQDGERTPLVVYKQNTKAQLDRSAFVSHDKIPRTPPRNDVTSSFQNASPSISDQSMEESYANSRLANHEAEASPRPSGKSFSRSRDAFSLHPAASNPMAFHRRVDGAYAASHSYCEELEMNSASSDEGEDVVDSNSTSSTSATKPKSEENFPYKLKPASSDFFSPAQASFLNEDRIKPAKFLKAPPADTLHSTSITSQPSLPAHLLTSCGQDSSTSSAIDNALSSLLDGNTSNAFEISSPSFAELSEEEELVPVTDTLVPLDDKPAHTPSKASRLPLPSGRNAIDLLMSTPPPMDVDGRKENVEVDSVPPDLTASSHIKDTDASGRPLLQEFHLNLLPTSESSMHTPDLQRFKSISLFRSKPN